MTELSKSNDPFAAGHYTEARIMAIFAHPDDEAFACGGTLAAYAGAGAEVTLICATRGEAGKITDPNMTVEDLGQQREAELRGACKVLGIAEPIFLDYHDSGRFERTRTDDPLALMNVKVFDIESRLLPHIEQHRPHVIITFDPHGGYGHIDHLKIQRAASAAYFSAGNFAYGGPQRLYYTGISTAETRQMDMLDPAHALEPERYGISEATVAVKLDISRWAEQKKAALAAHGTQMGPNSALGRLDPAVRAEFERRTLSQEWFSLGGTRTALATYPLPELLSGVDISR